jgi:zinc protease
MTRADRSRLPDLGAERLFSFPAIRRTTLANGLRVCTVEHRQVPLVSVLALVPAGASSDPANRPGLAAITGDMLDEGCGDRSALDVHDALGRIGAQLDIDVGHDATVLGLTTLERFLGPGLELMRDMLIRPRFEQREFDRVRDLRLNRLLQLKDMPQALADRAFTQLLYRNHPYGHLPIGTEGALRALGIRDITAFHRRAFIPSRTTVIAVGDQSHDALLGAVQRGFESWTLEASEPIADPDAFGTPLPPPTRLAVVHRPGSAQSELRIGHVGLARRTPDYHGALVANMILGGQFVSRINMNLREDKGYSYGARGSFTYSRSHGVFMASAPVAGSSTYQAILEIDREVRGLWSGDPAFAITADELERERAGAILGLPGRFATAQAALGQYRGLVYFGLPLDYYNSYVQSVERVSTADAMAAAAEHLRPGQAVYVVVGNGAENVIEHVQDAAAGPNTWTDVPHMSHGKQLTLREALSELAVRGDVGSGGLVELDADGRVR